MQQKCDFNALVVLDNKIPVDAFHTVFPIEEKVGNLSTKCFVQGLGAILHVQFVVDVVDVFLDGFLADE